MKYEIVRYGVVGFSKNKFDKKTAYKLLDNLFKELKEKHTDAIIEVVSGYTNSGIPKIAYELADKYGFITVGFSAKQALKVVSGTYPVSKVILKGEKFGEESAEFISYIDHLIRIGGGPQSRKETKLFTDKILIKKNDSILIEHEVDWYGE
ncbi:hypothetical protein [Tenacibaculum sp. M341]|uniref:hypothetical protein n=1 Tax=Tenacibaculum sp. M341 TaxID=2530339 RepID=UPI00104C5AB6|nr:hypothetical protein [Tenacibaculum sp. M341]TCI95068.1 hypothetical protein EYW44_01720 [Tenacibaculum sp. M341]